MQRNKVLVVGSLNVDLVSSVGALPKKGETIIGSSFAKHYGGKGGNQAIVAARLQSSVTMIGCVGQDPFGLELLQNLERENIDASGVHVVDHAPSGTALISVDQQGDNTIVVIPGANHALTPAMLDQNLTLFQQADVIVLQLEVPIDTVYHAIRLSKKWGKKVVLNTAPFHPLEQEILNDVDYLILNETEAEALVGVDQHQVEQLALSLTTATKGRVLLTLGSNGVVDIHQDHITHYEAYTVHAVDTTGAGDTFVGALSTMLNDHFAYPDAVRYAMKAASLTVQKMGTSQAFPRLEELQSFKSR